MLTLQASQWEVDYNTSGAQTFTADDYNLNGTDITFTTSADNVSFVDGGADGSIDPADAADLTISTSNGALGDWCTNPGNCW